MRQIVFLFSIFILTSCSNEKPQKIKKNNTTKTENVVEYYDSGLKKVEGQLRNEKPHGKWIFYHENGFKWSEGFFNEGERIGKSIVYYENGKIKMTGQYKKNIRTGIWKVFEEDGTFVDQIDLDSTLSRKDSIALELIPAQ